MHPFPMAQNFLNFMQFSWKFYSKIIGLCPLLMENPGFAPVSYSISPTRLFPVGITEL